VVLKFAEEDIADDKLAVKTLRNNSAVKLRGRSLSLGQKVRLDQSSRRRRLLSHGRAVQIIRLKRAVSFPPASTLTMAVSPTDSSTHALQTPDKSSPTPASGLKTMRAGVFERSWVDTVADSVEVTASSPVECSKSESVVEDDIVPMLIEDQVVLASTNDADHVVDVEVDGNRMDLSSPINDVSCSLLVHFVSSMLCNNICEL